MNKRPVVVDLFAGAGGFSLGFEQAGFDVVAAVEVDPVHAAIHKYNFPHCLTLPLSVTDLSGDAIRAQLKEDQRNVNIVIGGAPCQGFSLMGQRALDDPRNALVRHFVRLVRELDADYFVFENVKGLTVGRHRQVLTELIEEFDNAGYTVVKPWRVLNASSYGVPQNRERLILLGARKGRCLPGYPTALSKLAQDGGALDSLALTPTCFDALSDLPEAENFAELLVTDEMTTKNWGNPSDYAAELRALSGAKRWFEYRRKYDPEMLTSSARTNHSDISRRRFRETAPGRVEPISRFFKLASDGVSNTLRAGTDSARGAFTSPRPIHYEADRCITVREMARLHGFPDWFRLHETKWHGARQVGNAVPVPLARAIAFELMKALECQPSRPRKKVALGNTTLLRMTVSAAAVYWGIPNPSKRRDRKSGAKKRRQADIEALRLTEGQFQQSSWPMTSLPFLS